MFMKFRRFCCQCFWGVLISFLFLGCATFTQETEAPEALKFREFAAGATASLSPDSVSQKQNYPAASNAASSLSFFTSVRWGLGKKVEVAGDFGLYPGWFAGISVWSLNSRLRYQWLTLENGYLSTLSIGVFQSKQNITLSGDAVPYSIPNAVPPDTITHYAINEKGVSLSNSFGKNLSKKFAVYLGPKIYLVNFSGTYDHSLGSVEKLSYAGPLYGIFAGGILRLNKFLLDSKISLTQIPPNLRGSLAKWAPGINVTGQYLFW